jgi:hypothetical protein
VVAFWWRLTFQNSLTSGGAQVADDEKSHMAETKETINKTNDGISFIVSLRGLVRRGRALKQAGHAAGVDRGLHSQPAFPFCLFSCAVVLHKTEGGKYPGQLVFLEGCVNPSS